MIFEKKFLVPGWDERLMQKTVAYWSKREFVFEQSEGGGLFGKRGSIWGNLFSNNMSKLIAQLSISVSPVNELTCTLDVNTAMQYITTKNKKSLSQEMDMFESFLLRNDEKIEKGSEFRIEIR
jgi:hypothetical protein